MRKCCREIVTRRILLTDNIHSGLNVLAFIMIFLLMPETKQRTLEDLDYICKLCYSKYSPHR